MFMEGSPTRSFKGFSYGVLEFGNRGTFSQCFSVCYRPWFRFFELKFPGLCLSSVGQCRSRVCKLYSGILNPVYSAGARTLTVELFGRTRSEMEFRTDATSDHDSRVGSLGFKFGLEHGTSGSLLQAPLLTFRARGLRFVRQLTGRDVPYRPFLVFCHNTPRFRNSQLDYRLQPDIGRFIKLLGLKH